ncbi:MAG: GH116 family glycosyl-hydrolase [Clostridia bacterium]
MRRTEYVGDRTNEISFPLGGIGSGSIGLAGNGRLIDWEIFNRPNKESYNGFSHIAVKAERQGKLLDARVLNGDVNKGYSGPGTGLENTSMAGFPHFKKCVFYGEFPLAEIQFEDDHFPGKVTLRAFNPFIPLNDTDSSIPAAFMEVEFQNDGKEELQYSAAFTVRNPDQKGRNQFVKKNCVLLTTQYAEDHPQFGELCLATDADGEISHQEYWYRGGWSDSLETYWRNFTEQSNLKARRYEEPGDGDHGTLCVKQMVPLENQCEFVLFYLGTIRTTILTGIPIINI